MKAAQKARMSEVSPVASKAEKWVVKWAAVKVVQKASGWVGD
jgi:hypothetical protein